MDNQDLMRRLAALEHSVRTLAGRTAGTVNGSRRAILHIPDKLLTGIQVTDPQVLPTAMPQNNNNVNVDTTDVANLVNGKSPYDNAILGLKPSHYWKMNDAASGPFVDSADTVNATLAGTGGLFRQTGPFDANVDASTSFDAQGSAYGSAAVAALNDTGGSYSVTVVMWFKVNSVSPSTVYALCTQAQSQNPTGQGFTVHFSTDAGGLISEVGIDGVQQGLSKITPPPNIIDGNWHMLAAHFNGSTGALKPAMDISIDGAPYSTGTGATNPSGSLTVPFIIIGSAGQEGFGAATYTIPDAEVANVAYWGTSNGSTSDVNPVPNAIVKYLFDIGNPGAGAATAASDLGALFGTIAPNTILAGPSTGTANAAPAFRGPLVVADGGTGRSTLGAHGVLLGEGASAINATAAGASGNLLLGQGAADPLWKAMSGDATITNAGVISLTAPTAFTPVLTFGGLSTGITYTAQVGRYVSRGGVVVYTFHITLSSKGTANGTAAISLPVAIANIASLGAATGLVGGSANLAGLGGTVFIGGGAGATVAAFQQWNSAIGTAVLTDANFANNSDLTATIVYLSA